MVRFHHLLSPFFLSSHNLLPYNLRFLIAAEPGYYADGRFGIRIESIVIVKAAETPNHFGEKPYYGFENVTMVSNLTLLANVFSVHLLVLLHDSDHSISTK